MGGIVAMLSAGGAVSPELLERATRSLDHRGPDARRTWIDAGRSIGLGHTRLSTIDVSGGQQPIVNENGSIRAVVDGEFYHFEKIRAELIARGHQFQTQCDSEILVHLYEEHGASCIEHLRGEFAFALYDARRDLLVAARDRCGVKPLVYARHDGVLALASETKALLATGLSAAWDIESFLVSSVFGAPLEDATLFAGVQQVPAGHLLIAGRGHHHRLVRYWDYDYPVQDHGPTRSEADDREALATTLAEAVRIRLRADVPVACYLGGLDSCTVFGLTRGHVASPLPGFTLALGPEATQENSLAEAMALQYGADYTSIPVSRADLLQDLESVVQSVERPLSNVGCVLLYQLGRAVRRAGFKVVLTGEGADEIFAGYSHYLRDVELASPAETVMASSPSVQPAAGPAPIARELPEISMKPIRIALGQVPTWVQGTAKRNRALLGLLNRELSSRVARGEPAAKLIAGLETSRQLKRRHPVHQAMYLWSKSVLPGYILSASNDAIQMAHGLECRLPFVDHHLVELVTRLPIDRLTRGGVEKYLLREVARPVVSDAIYRRRKDQQPAPEFAAIENSLLDEHARDVLGGPMLSESPFFDRSRVLGLLDALPGCPGGARPALNALLMLVLSICLMQKRLGLGNAK